MHGTLVAGNLAARRGSQVPAICPDCTLLIRAVFSEEPKSIAEMPSATPAELTQAVLDAINACARVINLSLNAVASSARDKHQLESALTYAAARVVIVSAEECSCNCDVGFVTCPNPNAGGSPGCCVSDFRSAAMGNAYTVGRIRHSTLVCAYVNVIRVSVHAGYLTAVKTQKAKFATLDNAKCNLLTHVIPVSSPAMAHAAMPGQEKSV
jgi:hypothetical protein